MKLIGSLVALVMAGVLSVWLWAGQGTSDTVTNGVDITSQSGSTLLEPVPQQMADATADGLFTDEYAAAFVGLQAAMDVWRTTPAEIFSDPERFSGVLTEAHEAVVDEAAAAEKKREEAAAAEKKRAEEAAAEKARQEKRDREARAVTPAPVSPPEYDYDDDWDCEWDDGEWECED